GIDRSTRERRLAGVLAQGRATAYQQQVRPRPPHQDEEYWNGRGPGKRSGGRKKLEPQGAGQGGGAGGGAPGPPSARRPRPTGQATRGPPRFVSLRTTEQSRLEQLAGRCLIGRTLAEGRAQPADAAGTASRLA